MFRLRALAVTAATAATALVAGTVLAVSAGAAPAGATSGPATSQTTAVGGSQCTTTTATAGTAAGTTGAAGEPAVGAAVSPGSKPAAAAGASTTPAPDQPLRITAPAKAVSVTASSFTVAGSAPRGSTVTITRDANGNGRVDKGEPKAGAVTLKGTQTSWTLPLALTLNTPNRFVATATRAGKPSSTAAIPAITRTAPPTITAVADTPDPISPNHDGVADAATISYTLSRPAVITVRILDSRGRLVRALLALAKRPAGTSTASWDGRDSHRTVVAAGTYTYRVDAVALVDRTTFKTGTITVDPTAPTVAITTPTNGARTTSRALTATASDAGGITAVVFETSTDGSIWKSTGPADTTAPWAGALPGSLADGTYLVRARATDRAGNTGTSAVITMTLDTTAPAAPTGLTAGDVPADDGGAIALAWTPSGSPDVVAQCVFRAETGDFQPVATLAPTATSWTDSGLTDGHTYRYVLRAVDGVGLISAPTAPASAVPQPNNGSTDPTPTEPTETPTEPTTTPTTTPTDPTTTPTDPTTTPTGPTTPGTPGDIPPDPASVASPLDPTVRTDLGEATAFLYTGADPIQVGVAPGTIKGERAAVIRGTVHTRSGAGLPGVTVTVADHPEFGHTTTRDDGGYDLAVNGGGRLVVDVTKDGYPSAQRSVQTDWQDYAVVDDVTLIPYDTAVTPVDLTGEGTSIQVAQGSPVTDEDGTRQATLLFSPGTTAKATRSDGSTLDLADVHVRATEFTVGEDGPAAMPGELPAMSAYTYAAEFSVDEAVAAGADTVTFSKPVIDYTQNFLKFPVGSAVPTGYYDRDKHAWIAAKDGRVIKILSVTAGVATVDVAGKGVAATTAELSALGITADELTTLGGLYPAGTSLWRVAIDHFTPWDHNWPFTPPPGAIAPQLPELVADGDDICEGTVDGSIIGCDDQTLGERLPVTGTGLTLAYQSERTTGRDDRTVIVPVTGASVPSGVTRVLIKVEVAGQKTVFGTDPRPNITDTEHWDGKDAYGRTVQGSMIMTITVGYTYRGQYVSAANNGYSFGTFGVSAIDGDMTRQEITMWGVPQEVAVGGWDAKGAGLGGWTLSGQQFYDPIAQVLHRGDGTDSGGGDLTRSMQTVGGSGSSGFGGDGGPATAAKMAPRGVAAAPDGTVYIADQTNNRVRKIAPDGTITTIAGTGTNADTGDGGPAIAASLASPLAVAVAADGSVLVSTSRYRVRRIAPDGTITTIVGTGSPGWAGDGGPATAATLSTVSGMDVGTDGTVYLADSSACLIRAISPNGMIRRIGGVLPSPDSNDARCGYGNDGLKADKTFFNPQDVSVMPDGSLLIADGVNNRVRKIALDGTVSTVYTGNSPSSVEALPDGGFLEFDSWTTNQLRLIDTEGKARVIAGTGLPGDTGDGGPAAKAALNLVTAMAVKPDGTILLAAAGNYKIRAITTPLPNLTLDETAVVSADGSELYRYENGKHVTTVNTLTGVTTGTLAYDAHGLLVSITDADDNVTRVERDADGTPSAIVAPGGQRTQLVMDGAGYLKSVIAPGGATTSFTTDPNGLLRTMTDPGGGQHAFDYDAKGWLTKDSSPNGLSTTLSRTATATGHTVTSTSSTGRTTTLIVERLSGGVYRRTTVAPTGATVVGTVAVDGTRTITEPDGSVLTVTLGPDPRFGMAAPMLATQSLKTPSGLVTTRSLTVAAQLADPSDPLSVTSMTSKLTANGRTATLVYDRASHTLKATSPQGRTQVNTLDDHGRTVGIDIGNGIAPQSMVYGAHGLLQSTAQGGLQTSYTYDWRMRLETVTDPAQHVIRYGYDDADRLETITAPGGGVMTYGYDANGRVTSVKLPGGRMHLFAYDDGGRITSDDPSGQGDWTTAYDADGQPITRTGPSSTTTLGYDPTGMLTSATEDGISGGGVSFAYNASTGLPTSVSGDPGDGSAVSVRSFTFDGPLLTGAAVTGPVSASFGYTYNADLVPTKTTLTSGSDTVTVDRSYDKDLALTGVGGFTITRNAGGAATSMGNGTGVWTYHYDALGRLDSQTLTVAGTQVYRVDLTWGDDGTLTRRVEQTAGGATLDYRYDADGQLTDVLSGGVTVEHYAYDADGRRIGQQLNGGAIQTLSYDDADQLVRAAGVSYSYTADGSLSARGSDTFSYGFGGNLTSATVGGATVGYAYDADGRRISRTDAAGTTQYYYGSISSPMRVSAVRGPDGVLTALLYDEYGHLASFTRGGQRYYVATNQVGSPRVVTDATGAVVKTVAYDTFGRVRSDSAPSFFLPIGFAGGLTDPVTGLVRFGMRDYDPTTGRWTTRDPAGMSSGQADPYGYVGNDPVIHTDSSGLAEDGADEDPMTQDIQLDLWQYNKDRLSGLWDVATDKVKGWAGSLLCWGVCVNPNAPEVSVGKDITINAGGTDAVKVGMNCAVGLTTTPNLHEDNGSWKVKFSASIPFLKKIPLVGKYFGTDETYSGGFGAVKNYYGLDNQILRAAEVGGINVQGIDDMNAQSAGGGD